MKSPQKASASRPNEGLSDGNFGSTDRRRTPDFTSSAAEPSQHETHGAWGEEILILNVAWALRANRVLVG